MDKSGKSDLNVEELGTLTELIRSRVRLSATAYLNLMKENGLNPPLKPERPTMLTFLDPVGYQDLEQQTFLYMILKILMNIENGKVLELEYEGKLIPFTDIYTDLDRFRYAQFYNIKARADSAFELIEINILESFTLLKGEGEGWATGQVIISITNKKEARVYEKQFQAFPGVACIFSEAPLPINPEYIVKIKVICCFPCQIKITGQRHLILTDTIKQKVSLEDYGFRILF